MNDYNCERNCIKIVNKIYLKTGVENSSQQSGAVKRATYCRDINNVNDYILLSIV